MPREPELERAIGPWRATAMVVGTIVGASIFVQPSVVTGHVPTVAGVFAVWTVSGLLTLAGALVCAELASTHTQSGGVYVFLREALSPSLAFLWGWAMFWTVHTGIVAAVAVVCARYVATLVGLDPAQATGATRGTAVAVVLALTAIHYRGVRLGSALQTAFTVVKIAAVAAITAAGFALTSGAAAAGSPLEAAVEPTVGGFLAGVSAGLFAFGGWHMVTYNAGETLDPARTVPRALVIGTLTVTVCYLALNAAYLHVLPIETVTTSKAVAADAAAALGLGGRAAVSALVVFSTFGALIGIVLAGPRVYHAMARDGLLPGWLGAVHPRHHTPHRAVVLQGLWASVLVALGTYRELFTRVVYTEWIFFGLLGVALFVERRRPGVERAYTMRGHPWVTLAFVVSAFGIAASQIVANAGDALGMAGLALVALGLPVYHLGAGRRRRERAA